MFPRGCVGKMPFRVAQRAHTVDSAEPEKERKRETRPDGIAHRRCVPRKRKKHGKAVIGIDHGRKNGDSNFVYFGRFDSVRGSSEIFNIFFRFLLLFRFIIIFRMFPLCQRAGNREQGHNCDKCHISQIKALYYCTQHWLWTERALCVFRARSRIHDVSAHCWRSDYLFFEEKWSGNNNTNRNLGCNFKRVSLLQCSSDHRHRQ